MLDRIHKQIDYYNDRLRRYPDHPKADFMKSEVERLVALQRAYRDEKPKDRLLARVDTLVESIRQCKDKLASDCTTEEAKQYQRRINEYQRSISNIQSFGSEKPSQAQKAATTVHVPTDVMNVVDKI